MGFLSKLFKSSKVSCSDCKQVATIIHHVIDGEATCDEVEFFNKHIEKCSPCLDKYQVEKDMLQTVREKINRKCCPKATLESIKQKINQEK